MLATSCLVALVALIGERVAGYPAPLHRRIGHPVEWMGALIRMLDRRLNTAGGHGLLKLRGAVSLLVLIGCVLAVTLPLTIALRSAPGGWIAEAILAMPLIAQRDLYRFVAAVADALAHDVAAGREAVRHLVGRDPAALDESGVARAAVESLAENMSDGVVAPVIWLALLGLPGLALYKAINTADSMIGHRSERYLHFGWAAARLDDVVNLIPARLTGLVIALAAGLADFRALGRGIAAMIRDAPQHVSPNAGWPEAAMAGALRLRLGGPRSYEGRKVDLAWMGNGREVLAAADIRVALKLYRAALNVFAVLVAASTLALLVTR